MKSENKIPNKYPTKLWAPISGYFIQNDTKVAMAYHSTKGNNFFHVLAQCFVIRPREWRSMPHRITSVIVHVKFIYIVISRKIINCKLCSYHTHWEKVSIDVVYRFWLMINSHINFCLPRKSLLVFNCSLGKSLLTQFPHC